MSFSKKIIAGVAAVATLAALAPAVAMAEGDAPATQQQTQAADAFITVHGNGGTWAGGALGDASASGKVGDKFATFASQLPTISRKGYTFAGYSTTKDGSSIISNNVVINKSYTELWVAWTKNEAKTFNVTVHANGGTFTSGNNTGQAGDYMVTVKNGGSLVSALPQVQRDGYLFAGWSYDKDGKSPIVATDFVSAYTEVYAQWTKQKPVVDAKQFNVIVSTNGGTIADGDHKGEAGDIQVSAAQDSVLVNALPTVTREGVWAGVAMMVIIGLILITGILPKISKYVPASSIAGFLFVLGIFKTVALDAPAALAMNAAVGGSTLVVTAVTNPFLGMLAGIVVRMLGI